MLHDVLSFCAVKSDPVDIYLSPGKQQQTQHDVQRPHSD